MVRGLDGIAIEINGVADHVHVLAKIRPIISISEFMSKLKSGSSGWAKRQTNGRFGWQARFGAFTVSESQVERVRRYIRNQEEHHRKRTGLISMKLICGAEALSPASQARLILFDDSPGSASPRQGLHSVRLLTQAG